MGEPWIGDAIPPGDVIGDAVGEKMEGELFRTE